MARPSSLFLYLFVLTLVSCAPTNSTGPHAIVVLRDGSSVAGMVLSSSSTAMTVAGDDKVTKTISMVQVQSVTYDASSTPSAAPAVANPAPSSAAPSSTPSTSSASTAAAPATAPPDPIHDNHYHPDRSAITTTTFEVPAGTKVEVRTEETIDSGHAAEGQTFAAEVARDVRDAAGKVVIPRGANAQVVIRSESKGGKIRGAADLVLDLAAVSVNGQRYQLRTRNLTESGHEGVGANKRTGEFAGGGAAVGAIIGAIAGHGKGAAIGAGSGAGAGLLTEILTKGDSIKIPVESVLTFQLARPLVVTA